MGAELTGFTFPDTGQNVRTVTIDDEPWFLAVDVCAVLDIRNVADAMTSLDDDEKAPVANLAITDVGRGGRAPWAISEPGLYSLILRSRKQQAKGFRRWVTHEVIPALRRTGRYDPQPPRQLTRLELIDLAREAETGRLAAEERAAALAPAAHSWNVLGSSEGDYSVADAAKILSRDPAISMGRDRLFAVLREEGWAYRSREDGKLRAMQRAVDAGRLAEMPQSYVHPESQERVLGAAQIRVTVKGLHALHRLLGGVWQLRLDDAA